MLEEHFLELRNVGTRQRSICADFRDGDVVLVLTEEMAGFLAEALERVGDGNEVERLLVTDDAR
jgi:hypothetical protein